MTRNMICILICNSKKKNGGCLRLAFDCDYLLGKAIAHILLTWQGTTLVFAYILLTEQGLMQHRIKYPTYFC